MNVKVISLPYIFQVLYVLCFTRPRYQVSVYRTIGPLVSFSNFAARTTKLIVFKQVILKMAENLGVSVLKIGSYPSPKSNHMYSDAEVIVP